MLYVYITLAIIAYGLIGALARASYLCHVKNTKNYISYSERDNGFIIGLCWPIVLIFLILSAPVKIFEKISDYFMNLCCKFRNIKG